MADAVLPRVTARREIKEWLADMKSADILVGIPSYNNARTIPHVVRAIQAGFNKYFPGHRAVLVNSDGGSRDGTAEAFSSATLAGSLALQEKFRSQPQFRQTFPYDGIPGKGSAFRAIFELAQALNVTACAVVDSDLRSISPEWVELLLKPVVDGDADFVAPLYRRHKYDGTITNSIVYPLTRALYGKRIRQPIGGDFGFSGKLAGFYLEKDVWETDVARFGIDIWMTTTAVANGFRVCQSFLGAKIHDAKDPGADLSTMLYQVLSAMLDLVIEYEPVWRKTGPSEPVPKFGFEYEVGTEPINVNTARMVGIFRNGLKDLRSIWEKVLPPDVMASLDKTAAGDERVFTMPDALWADIVYAYAIAYRDSVFSREHLIKSMTPLYLARTASWVITAAAMDGDAVERRIDELCAVFEEKKDAFAARWSGRNQP